MYKIYSEELYRENKVKAIYFTLFFIHTVAVLAIIKALI